MQAISGHPCGNHDIFPSHHEHSRAHIEALVAILAAAGYVVLLVDMNAARQYLPTPRYRAYGLGLHTSLGSVEHLTERLALAKQLLAGWQASYADCLPLEDFLEANAEASPANTIVGQARHMLSI